MSSRVLLTCNRTPINAVVKAVPYSAWAVLLVRIVFVANIVIALLPLIRRYYPDEIADIPLTPSQRASMGLKAGVQAPHSPGSAFASPNYVTPPRYQRSTPRSNSFSNQEFGSHSPNFGRSGSGSPFSPNNGNLQRSLSGSTTKRLSYGGSSMGSSLFGDSSSSVAPSTPTPSTGKASVSLNNKWLYEKRRDSPKSSMFAQ
jgi:nucleoporin POM34